MVKNEMLLDSPSNSYIKINTQVSKASQNGYDMSPGSPKYKKSWSPDKRAWGSRLWTNLRLYSVVLSIGAGVVDNLLPIAHPYLMKLYPNKEHADFIWEWIVSSRIYGVAVGCFLSILLCNCSARKIPLVVALLMDLLGGLMCGLIVYAPFGVYVTIVGRFINGIGSGIAQVVGSAMLAEIPPLHSRGTALATLTVWACLGELVGMIISLDSVLGRPNTWHLALILPNILLPIALLCLIFAPDSPRCLVMASKLEDAKKSLEFYQCAEDWEKSMQDITEEFEVIDSDSSGSDSDDSTDVNENQVKKRTPQGCTIGKAQTFGTIMSRFQTGRFVRPLMITAFVQTFIHLDDWLWISYSTQVFENTGLSERTAMRASLYMSLPQAFLSVSLLFCFDSFSRRWLLITPTIGSIICSTLVVSGLMRTDGKLFGIVEMSRMMPIFAAIDLSLAAFASESAYSVVPELFSQRDRILGTAIVGIAQNFFGGILSNFILSIVNIYGTQFVLLPFIILNIIYVIGIYWYLPETNGKSFQAIAQYFKRDLPGASTVRTLKKWLQNIVKVLKTLFVAPPTGRKVTTVCVMIAQIFLFAFVMHIFLKIVASYFFMYKYA